MKKRELLLSLTVPRAYFVYGMALHRVASARPKDLTEYLGGGAEMVFADEARGHARVPGCIRPLTLPLLQKLQEPTGPAELQSALGVALGRTLVRDSFETIVAYCGGLDDPRFKAIEDDELLVFARIVRNTFSHEHGVRILHWPRRLRDRVSWRGHALDRASVHRPLRFEPYDYYQLHDDLMNYANEKLPDVGDDAPPPKVAKEIGPLAQDG